MPEGKAVMITSSNALPAIAHWPKALPCFCVGTRTAEAAKQAGFLSVIEAGGDGAALVERLKAEGFAAGCTIVHPCGAEKAMDYGAALASIGLVYQPVEAYRAQAVDVLPLEAASALRDGTLQAVLHFSPRSARLFTGLCDKAGLRSRAEALTHYCLSQSVADALGASYFRHSISAYFPSEDDLLSMLPR
jgi:uroporphyrinogen-III synthase